MATSGAATSSAKLQKMRFDMLVHLLETVPGGTIQGHMLSVSAMLTFVETGRILGIDSGEDEPAGAKRRRKQAGTTSRAN